MIPLDAPALPDRLTLETLAERLDPTTPPVVEVQSLDMGYYLVRLHHTGGESLLVDDEGDTRRFTGTQWISRALSPLGLTHGTLTWADVTDEMIGLPAVPPLEAAARLAHGTRIAFMTRG
ncbi:hypothetical protein FHR95_000254 [Halomonas fontilapidosi]|uniref:Uncharacterized protein n=1 Tax=Halomonas fontilapidosi TaxID=616675 RepID=A0A7W5DHQ0_9GAMM|nr:DUF6482 family protein [Halomonas fontilapidosi]MBB3182730.1 hypothetical protein [Halomonas fontilapidosi]